MKNITSPTLLLDENICKINIHAMANKAKEHDLDFKPHMKTHQSATIGHWLRDADIEATTVSSVKMAQYFARHGWNDITIAFPCNIRQIDDLNELAANISLTILVNKTDVAKALDKKLQSPVSAYIEIDSGSARSGLPSDDIREIRSVIEVINTSNNITWAGLYSHPGHSYACRSKQQIEAVHHAVIRQFKQLKDELSQSYHDFEVCIGDTPCCSIGDTFGPVDAISPGNFVFYDLMQQQIGSCKFGDIAVAMACPIVDKYESHNQLIIQGGAIHFSKEFMKTNDTTHFGLVAERNDNSWKPVEPYSYVTKLSQEHGVVSCSAKLFQNYDIGDMVTVLPVHSCLTANLMSGYQTIGGEQISMMK
ncbi:alanine racemase [Fodinibius sp. Rm-B-1B1-1]|uniref:alanine racemase n=1 Tax=Fodinibius alkaliphilus TaxID=3140241 RepID=UPI00315B27B0